MCIGMCIVFFIRVRDQRSTEKTYSWGIRSWLQQHFTKDKNNHGKDQSDSPPYIKAKQAVNSRTGDAQVAGSPN